MTSVFNKIKEERTEIEEILSNPYKNIEEMDANFGVSIYKFFEVLYDLFGTGTQAQRNASMKEMLHLKFF